MKISGEAWFKLALWVAVVVGVSFKTDWAWGLIVGTILFFLEPNNGRRVQ